MFKFLTENLDLILSSDDRRETIRLKKKDFFHKNSLKSSENFTLKELAFNTLRYLIDNYRIKSEDDIIKYIESSAFISYYITKRNIEALIGLIKPPQSTILSPKDLGQLKTQDFLRKTEQQFIDRAREIIETDLEEQREKLNSERQELEELRIQTEKHFEEAQYESQLDLLPTTINPEDYVVYEELGEQIASSAVMNWWHKLGLIEDPFPTKFGLSRIPENKYEKVVVHTQIFIDYLKIINDSPKMLFGKTILIHGLFGAGKTTFLQYISYKLAPHKILPLYVVLDPIGDIDIIRQNFYSETFNLISNSMRRRGLGDPRSQGPMLDRNTIANTLIYLSKEAQIDGFVLTIDGLHKAESTLESTLEFFKQLQNFHEYMENYGVNICIFIAGSPLWLRRITQNAAFSGSYYKIDEVTSISFDEAYSLLIKRIQAYKRPDIEVFFEKDSVRVAYDSILKNQGGTVTFRSFLDYVIPRLEKGDFKGVGLSVSVDLEIIRQIDRELLGSIMRDSYKLYNQLTRDSVKLRQACAYALLQIFKNRHFGEWNDGFTSNKGAFYILRKTQLIRRFYTEKGLGWTLSDEFVPILDNLLEQGYPPSIVFKAFSIDATAPSESSLRKDIILESGEDFLAKWESEWPEIVSYIKNFLEDHKLISANIAEGTNKDVCSECRSSILHLITCAQIVLKNKETPEEWLDSTWLDIPPLRIIKSIILQEKLAPSERMEYYNRYCTSASFMLEILNQLLDVNRLVNILTSKNGTEEMRALMRAGVYLNDGDFDSAIEEVNSKIEERIRTVFHLSFSLHYGNNYLNKLPRHIQERIEDTPKKGPPGLKREIDVNLFYHFSRSEYAEIVNEKRHWQTFFNKIFAPNKRDKIVEMLQLTFSLDNRIQHRDRADYFRILREEIRKVIINADYLLYALAETLNLSINPEGFSHELKENINHIKVSFNSRRLNAAHLFKLPRINALDISKRLMSVKRKYNFSHELAISTLLNCTFSEAFIILSILVKNGRIIVDPCPESRMYLHLTPVEKARAQ